MVIGKKGIALILTTTISLLFVLLVAGFYHVIIGRHRWTHKRIDRSDRFYKSEAGAQDARSRLRIGKLNPAAVGAIDPNTIVPVRYCLDLDTDPPTRQPDDTQCPSDPANLLNPSSWGVWDVRVEVSPKNADGMNPIYAESVF